jgi:hypothetical protein
MCALLKKMNLRTLKKASAEIGTSISFLKQLIREGKLTRYKINSATFISLTEFEKLAFPVDRESIPFRPQDPIKSAKPHTVTRFDNLSA